MANLYKKNVYVKDPKTGKKVQSQSKNWWARCTDADGIERRGALVADKSVAQKMLAELIQRSERGMKTDPFTEALKISVDEHLDEFEQHLIDKNSTPDHVTQSVNRIKLYVAQMKPKTIAQVDTASVEKLLAARRRTNSISLQTCNHYIRTIKCFCNWLVKRKRLAVHPLLDLELFNPDIDPRHARRPLEPEEFEYMLEAAAKGGTVESISGRDRRMFYILAAWTGFRMGELGSVTLRHFKLDGEYPTLTIRASYSKRKREDAQFLHPDVVAEFNAWVDEKNPGPDELLFPVSEKAGGIERKTSYMVEKDLALARIVWINEANSNEERAAREASQLVDHLGGDRCDTLTMEQGLVFRHDCTSYVGRGIEFTRKDLAFFVPTSYNEASALRGLMFGVSEYFSELGRNAFFIICRFPRRLSFPPPFRQFFGGCQLAFSLQPHWLDPTHAGLLPAIVPDQVGPYRSWFSFYTSK